MERKENDRPVFVITYNPALPSLSQILKKHWKVMIKDPYLKEVFPAPPMVAYRRAKNLRDKLVKAKVPPPSIRKKRQLNGMKPCNKSGCEVCPFVRRGSEMKIHLSNKSVKINSNVDCNSQNTVYCMFCKKPRCNQVFIGQSQRELKKRFSEHKTSVRTNAKKVVGQHFNEPGHSISNMEVAALEKVFDRGKQIIEKRESMWIENLEAEFKGLNQKQ